MNLTLHEGISTSSIVGERVSTSDRCNEMATNVSRDREPELVNDKIQECLGRLKGPNANLTWSQINSEYGQYGITKKDVYKHMRGIQKGKPRGRPPSLSVELEKSIVDCIITCEQRGYSKTKKDVENELIIPLASGSDKYPFKKTASGEYLGPSKIWWAGFLRRHNERMLFKTASPVVRVRAAAANPRAFISVNEMLRGRMDIPENIVMIDETSIPSKPGWEAKVLGERNKRPAHIPAGTVDERHMTLVAACSADGRMLPPAYICAGKHIMEASDRKGILFDHSPATPSCIDFDLCLYLPDVMNPSSRTGT